MCRFAFYLGPEISLASLVVAPDHSIIHQSFHAREREEPLNGDGYGVAWYEPAIRSEPVLFREVSPAWSSANLASLAPVANSECILAHVRAATSGLSVSQLNCHPFCYKQYAFMHNGEVASFASIKRRLLADLSDRAYHSIDGSTDSELVFAMIIDALDAQINEASLEQMAEAMGLVIEQVEKAAAGAGSTHSSHLNLVLTNGTEAVISRYATPNTDQGQTLYLHQGGRYHCIDGTCSMSEAPELASDPRQTIIAASEPLTSEAGWQSVPMNHLCLINQQREVTMRPLHSNVRNG